MTIKRSYTSHEPSAQLLKEGDNTVHAISIIECGSFDIVELVNGKLAVTGKKANLPEWTDETGQIAVHVGNDSGSVVHRFNEDGFDKYATDLSNEQRASGIFTEVRGYACFINKKKKLVRLVSEKNTAKCARLIERFVFALAGKAGVDINVAVDNALATKSEFVVRIIKEPYTDDDGKSVNQTRVATDGFYAIGDKRLEKDAPKKSSSLPSDMEA